MLPVSRGARRPLRRRRRARNALAVLAVAALPLAGLALPSSASADDGGGLTTIYVAQKQCGAPTAGEATCFAEKLVAKRVAAGSGAARSTPVRTDAGRGPAGGYTPTQLIKAYALDRTVDASDQVVAVVGAYHSPNLLKNLNAFDKKYGLPQESTATIRVINGLNGTTTLPTTTNSGWASEADLDVQAVRGLCRTCKILVTEAKSPSSSRLGTSVGTAAGYTWVRRDGVRLKVGVVSNSYGASEVPSAKDVDEVKFDHPGTAVLASVGDAGWFDWDYARTNHPEWVGNAANVPASYPGVIGVGGTTLKVDSDDQRSSEYVWDRDGNEGGASTGGATGSGCSEQWPANQWQSGADGYGTLGCTSGKASEVDLAALADPYTGYDVYTTGGWATFGGTSLSSPMVAAMWALAGGPRGVDRPEQTLYQSFAAGTGLHDVTYGGNGACGTDSAAVCEYYFGGRDPNSLGYGPIDCQFAWGARQGHAHRKGDATYQCNARSGLDGPSGVGTPDGLAAFRPAT